MTKLKQKEQVTLHNMPEYLWKDVRQKVINVKQFGSWTLKNTEIEGLCQIKGCMEVAKWSTQLLTGKGIILCFSHGEDSYKKR